MAFWGSSRRRERRRTPRYTPPALVAYYWTGAVPYPRKVRDIGLHGAHVNAPDTFYPGTLIQVIFEDRGDGETDGEAPNICLHAAVLGCGADGFSLEFAFENGQERRRFRRFLEDLKVRDAARAAHAAEIAATEQAQGAEEEEESSDAAGPAA